jgi:hypothetical protein
MVGSKKRALGSLLGIDDSGVDVDLFKRMAFLRLLDSTIGTPMDVIVVTRTVF